MTTRWTTPSFFARRARRSQPSWPNLLPWLRGANAVDGYDHPEPYDADIDAPSDEYVERFTSWAIP